MADWHKGLSAKLHKAASRHSKQNCHFVFFLEFSSKKYGMIKKELLLWLQFVRIWVDINFVFLTTIQQVKELMSSTHEKVTHLSAWSCLPWAADPDLMLGELSVSYSQQHSPCQPNNDPLRSPQSHTKLSGFIHGNNWAAMLAGSSVLHP